MKGALLFLLATIVAVTGTAFAVPPGMTVEFEIGSVTFDGDRHANEGLKCAECHPDPFQYKKGAVKITIKDHVPGRMCGTCHDGKKGFAIKTCNCTRCHRLPEGAAK